MALPTASDNPFPSLLITEGTVPASPAASKQRLYVNSTSHRLVRVNSSGVETIVDGLNSGTAFPGSPATGQMFFRTDLAFECYYDGTRWLTMPTQEPFAALGSSLPLTTSPNNGGYVAMPHTDYDVWVYAAYVSTYVATTNTGSAYWTVDVQKVDAAAAGTSLGSYNTSTHTVNNWTTAKVTIGASVVKTTNKVIQFALTKTSTPGGIYIVGKLVYSLIVT